MLRPKKPHDKDGMLTPKPKDKPVASKDPTSIENIKYTPGHRNRVRDQHGGGHKH